MDLDVVGGGGGREGLSNTNSDDLNFDTFDSAFDFFDLALGFSYFIDLNNVMAPPLPQ